MSAFAINGVVQAEYAYNALGQQVVRRLTQAGHTIHSVHDAAGNRIAEYLYDETTLTSTLIREYIWADGMIVAVVEAGQMYYVRTDHIGRPVFATDGTGTNVWEATYLPFGGVHTTTGSPITLRFPGQWFQSETGLHQNWMRDYDPTTGRYLQADPLGLVDGASMYGYALQNPARYVDPRGEDSITMNPGQTGGQSFPGGQTAGGQGIVNGGISTGVRGISLGLTLALTPTQMGDGTRPLPLVNQCEPECTPANALFWNSLSNYRGEIRKDGIGRKRRYYTWDRLHYCEVEVFDRHGNHLGSLDGMTGRPIAGKGPKPTHRLRL